MLRITEIHRNGDGMTLRLEGSLVGPWVRTLRAACEESLTQGKQLTVDLAQLSFAGYEGVRLLKELQNRGASMVQASKFIGELLSDSGRNDQK